MKYTTNIVGQEPRTGLSLIDATMAIREHLVRAPAGEVATVTDEAGTVVRRIEATEGGIPRQTYRMR